MNRRSRASRSSEIRPRSSSRRRSRLAEGAETPVRAPTLLTVAFASCSPGYMGVYYCNGSGTIDTLHVAHIVLPTATGCQSVVGVFVQSGGSGSSTVNLKTSTIDQGIVTTADLLEPTYEPIKGNR